MIEFLCHGYYFCLHRGEIRSTEMCPQVLQKFDPIAQYNFRIPLQVSDLLFRHIETDQS